MTEREMKRVLGVGDLILFNVTVVFSLRGIAAAAGMGPIAIPLWLLAVATFFVPLALTVTELATRDPEEGGFYRWIQRAFGDGHAFLAGWSYWLSNLTYLPQLLVFAAGNVRFVLGRETARGGATLSPLALGLALAVLWALTWINVRGLALARHVHRAGALASWLAALLLVGAGVIALVRYGSRTDWSEASFATLARGRSIGLFGTLFFSLVGLELAPLMGGEIRDPRRTVPRAIAISGLGIALLYVLGTTAILVAVPPEEASALTGVLDAVERVSERAGWPFLPRLVAVLVSFATVAGLSAWLGAMARLPYAVGLDRFLPGWIAEIHPRHGTPHRSILLQAGATTVLLAASAGARLEKAYALLQIATTILTIVPFLYLFLCLPRLRPPGPEPGVVRAPGGMGAARGLALAGFLSSSVALAASVIPPPEAGDPWVFEAKLWGGLVVLASLGALLYRRFRRSH
jgi:amino acid transporter